MIAFVPHATSGATVTLNVDSLGAKPLRTSPGVELPSGLLIQGTPYVATYNNTDGAFYLQGFYSLPYAIPVGGLLPYVGSSAPNSAFALPFGQAISRTTYAGLFALVGTTFGGGDGSTTFNIPDLRGRVPVGQDNMGGSAANRVGSVVTDNGTIIGSTIGSVGGSSTHIQTGGEVGAHTHGITDPGHVHNMGLFLGNGSIGSGIVYLSSTSNGSNTTSATTGISVNNSTAPSAMAWLQPSVILPYILRVI
jgi:microcystin-dependent protein